MRVTVDATCLGRRKTGNETYIRGLLRGFSELSLGDVELCILTTEACPEMVKSKAFSWYEIPLGNFFTRNIFTIPKYLSELQTDLYHSSYWTKFWKAHPPKIVMIHDISFICFPHGFRKYEQLFYAAITERVAKAADHILTVSNYSKETMLEHWNIPEHKITVTYNGIDDCYKPTSQDTKQFGEVPYILYVGNLHPRKNLVRLLKAFVKIKREKKIEHKLKIVGQATWLYEDIFLEVKENTLEEHVEFTGYVSQEELVKIYQKATLTCYPSLFEGFGLPVLEAMACGSPVVTSNTTSIPEVAADAAVLVDPESVDQIASAILSIIESKELQSSLKQKSLKQARSFSWKETASKTLKAYYNCL
ncbi:MAG: glycosyltransferase family 1 protein [Verrucomicrobiota bacterium]